MPNIQVDLPQAAYEIAIAANSLKQLGSKMQAAKFGR